MSDLTDKTFEEIGRATGVKLQPCCMRALRDIDRRTDFARISMYGKYAPLFVGKGLTANVSKNLAGLINAAIKDQTGISFNEALKGMPVIAAGANRDECAMESMKHHGDLGRFWKRFHDYFESKVAR